MNVGYLVLGLIAGMGLPIQAAINTPPWRHVGQSAAYIGAGFICCWYFDPHRGVGGFADWYTVQQDDPSR